MSVFDIPQLLGSLTEKKGFGENEGSRRLDVTFRPTCDLRITRVVNAYFIVPEHYQVPGLTSQASHTKKTASDSYFVGANSSFPSLTLPFLTDYIHPPVLWQTRRTMPDPHGPSPVVASRSSEKHHRTRKSCAA